MTGKREITRDDILPMAAYAAERKERKRRIAGIKKHRRLDVGPFASFYFESYETMWQQIHEMLYIEKGASPAATVAALSATSASAPCSSCGMPQQPG